AVTYTSDFGPSLDGFVDDTVALAQLSEPDELNELPDPSLFARDTPDLALWDDAALSTTAHDAIELCRAGERAARGYSPRVTNSEGASYGRTVGGRALVIAGRGGERFAGGYR